LCLELIGLLREFGKATLLSFQRCQEIGLLLQQFGVEGFELLPQFLLTLIGCLSFRYFLLQFLHLILYARDVQHGFHLLPQFPPWPQAQLHVLA